MTPTDRALLVEQLVDDEALRLTPYKDSVGVLTLGVGHNLNKPITKRAALHILDDDIDDAAKAATAYPWFADLDAVRQRVILSMLFNLGPGGFALFRMLIHAMATKNYPEAARQMRQSLWADQVGARARTLAVRMETGEE